MKTDRLLEYQILKLWGDLKKERKITGISSTRLKISAKIQETSLKEVITQ